MKRCLIFLLSGLTMLQVANAQNWSTVYFYPLDHLIKGKNAAKTDLEKIRWLGLLNLKYDVLGEKTKADSCLKERKDIALNSRDRVVMTEHYTWEIINSSGVSDSGKQRKYALCHELIEIGQRENVPVAIVVGNGYLGWGLAGEGKMEQAYGHLNNMLNAALESGDDSLIAEAYSFYTNTYFLKNNYLQAYKYQLKALDIAEKMNNDYLLWEYNSWLSNIYRKFKDKEKSMDYKMKLLDFAKKTEEPYDDLAAIKSIGLGFLNWTHGEPLKIFLIKIGLVALLLPLHQFIERRVIHFLVSRKLMRLRDGRFWRMLFGDAELEAKVEKT